MKILKTGLIVFCSSALLMMSGCASNPSTGSLAGTKWHYSDDDWKYDLEFAAGGVLRSSHPNDKTKDNDSWEQDGNNVNFYFNNKFSTYNGTISGDNQMSGSASSKNGSKWTWKATKAE